jgi:NAD-dependent DNA ligase
MPMLNETEVIDIEWNLGKTGEYIPTIITNPVEMDGKMISRASGSNYGKLIDNKISIGTKVILSLAGDIIPFIYKITNTDNYSIDNLNLPTEHDTYVDDCHLYAVLSEDDFNRNKFMASVGALNINHIGSATAKQILEYVTKDNGLTDDFFGEVNTKEIPSNILLVSSDDIYFGSGAGKTGDNAKKAFNDMLDQLRLVEIIKSCSFKFCGPKVAEQIEKYLLGQSYDFTSMASEGYEWAFDKNSKNYKEIEHIVSSLGKTFDDFKERIVEEVVSSEDKIPVILTGEPNDYASKAEFIRLNPQYRVTGKWTEVQIVFTNSLESNTGKMKRAKEKNIEIRLY